MYKLLDDNGEGIIWIQKDNEQIYGILADRRVLDDHGCPFSRDAVLVLDDAGYEVSRRYLWGEESITVWRESIEYRILFLNETVNLVEVEK